MRVFGILALVFGIVLAGGAVYYAQQFMDARLNAVRADPATVRILVASQRLSQGDLLGAEHLQWVAWPAASIPDGAYISTTAVFGPEQDQRRYVKRTIEPGEPILEAKLSAPNQAGTIKDILTPDMRAVAIRIDDVTGISGLVSAGDHVDILLTRQIEASLVSSVVLQDVAILAIGQSFDTEQHTPQLARTVTVAVTVWDAQLLAVAQETGRLSLSLRGHDAAAAGKARPVSEDELNDLETPAAKPGKTIRVRKGTTVEEVPVD